MQNKGLIKLFAILFGLVSLYQLSFTWFTNGVEDKAKIYAESKSDDGKEIARLEGVYLDSVANKPVIDLGFAQFSYNDINRNYCRNNVEEDLYHGRHFRFGCRE